MNLWTPLIIGAVSALLVTAAAVVLFRRYWRRPSPARRRALNLATALLSTLYCLLVADAIFGLLVVQSDGFSFTLSARRWMETYWHPLNASGLRDVDHPAGSYRDHVLVVLGDSFVAGHGIEHAEDRFANVLAQHLGPSWTLVILADNGWGPREELEALRELPAHPTALIVSHFINDIQSAAEDLHVPPPDLVTPPPAWIAPIVDHSFLANWLYWRLYRRHLTEPYLTYLKAAYERSDIWARHLAYLDEFIEYAAARGCRLLFLVWPYPADVAGSAAYTRPVTEALKERDQLVVDLTDTLAGRPAAALVVNSMDGHPNAAVHREVGELLARDYGAWLAGGALDGAGASR